MKDKLKYIMFGLFMGFLFTGLFFAVSVFFITRGMMWYGVPLLIYSLLLFCGTTVGCVRDIHNYNSNPQKFMRGEAVYHIRK